MPKHLPNDYSLAAALCELLIGSLYGSGRPLLDIPHLVTLYQAGELKLRELVTRTYHLDGINDALAALAAGEGARGIIRW